MKQSWFLKVILALFGLALLAVLLYQVPWINQRASWRLDIARTYLRGVINPVSGVPTPAAAVNTLGVTLTPTTAPSPTPGDAAPPTATLSPTPAPTPTPLPSRVQLASPLYEKQDWNNCGPASLVMYLRYYGWEGDQFTISDVLKPNREDRNVNIEELAHYTRNYAGWLQTQYRVGGDLDLLRALVAAGIPVMIESSFYFEDPYWPNDDLWAAHYLMVTGYDDAAGTFTVQDSFYGGDKVLPGDELDSYWQSFNRVYFLLYLPPQEETVKSILEDQWDVDANRQHALDEAQREIDEYPGDAFAWFNLGSNLVYFERYEEAAAAYDEARKVGLPQRMLRYQFGPFLSYFHTGRNVDLLALTEYALQRTPNAEEALLWHGWALYRDGDANGALADFYQALEENPNYLDAQYAINYITGQ